MGSSLSLDPAFPPLRAVTAELGVRAWAVGGYVRDWLLQRPHPDLDVVVEGEALNLARAFAERVGARAPLEFPRFGTARVVWGKRVVEFASARKEAYVPTSRKPEVAPASLTEDLIRRDFTINTLLMDLDGGIHDLLGGRADLQKRVLRTPTDPFQTFSDDPLRMLRGIRFAADLGFELDEGLLPTMTKLRGRLGPPVVAIERIREEISRLLISPRPKLGLKLMDEGGLLEGIWPELIACKGVEQGGWHTHDVYGHTLLVVEHIEPELRLRLAALLHDVGKPLVAAPDGTFHGHAEAGAELSERALARLRFPNQLISEVRQLVSLHMRPIAYSSEWSDGAVRRLARAAGGLLPSLLSLARADTAASAYPRLEEVDDLKRRLEEVLTEQPNRLRIPVDGREIMRQRDIPPGPEVGRIKARLEELVMEGQLDPEREAIMAYLEEHPDM